MNCSLWEITVTVKGLGFREGLKRLNESFYDSHTISVFFFHFQCGQIVPHICIFESQGTELTGWFLPSPQVQKAPGLKQRWIHYQALGSFLTPGLRSFCLSLSLPFLLLLFSLFPGLHSSWFLSSCRGLVLFHGWFWLPSQSTFWILLSYRLPTPHWFLFIPRLPANQTHLWSIILV